MKSSLKLAVVLSLLLSGSRARAAAPCSASAVQACFPALTLAAPGGNPGIPRVITWRDTTGASGVAWGTTSAITAANAYITYNSGSAALQHNVPAGNIFGFLDNGVEHGYIQPAGTTEIFGADSGTVQLASGIADGGTAKAVIAQAGTAFATAGAEIFSVQNGLTEKFGFKWDSGIVFSTTLKPAAADYGISQDGSNLIFGAPTGKGFGFNVNGVSQFTISNTGAATLASTLSLTNSTLNLIADSVGIQQNGLIGLRVESVQANHTDMVKQVEVGHLAGGSGAPTSPTAGTGCGTSSAPTVNAGSSDSSGDIQVVCGSAGTAGNPYLTITFAHAYNTAPNCVIFPANAQTAGGVVASDEFVSTTTGTLVINCGTGGTCTTNASALRWKYVCQQ